MSSESPKRNYVDPLLIETYKVSVLLTTVSMATNEMCRRLWSLRSDKFVYCFSPRHIHLISNIVPGSRFSFKPVFVMYTAAPPLSSVQVLGRLIVDSAVFVIGGCCN